MAELYQTIKNLTPLSLVGNQKQLIEHMKNKYDRMDPPKHAKLGGLFFDEVKIKEGSVFDNSSWVLIGFTDALEGNKERNFLQKSVF